MSHPYYGGTAALSGDDAWYSNILNEWGITSPDKTGDEQGPGFWDIVAGGTEYLTIRERQKAAEAEAEAIEAKRRLLLEMQVAQEQQQQQSQGPNYTPWIIGGAAVAALGAILYFTMK